MLVISMLVISLGLRLHVSAGVARRVATRAAVVSPPATSSPARASAPRAHPAALRVSATESARHWRRVAKAAESAALGGWFGERGADDHLGLVVRGLALSERRGGDLAPTGAGARLAADLARALGEADEGGAAALLGEALQRSPTAVEHLAAVCEGLSAAAGSAEALGGLVCALGLGGRQSLARLECVDISHLQGRATVGAYSVLAGGVPVLAQYGCVAISGAGRGDDPAAIRETLRWRLAPGGQGGPLPSLLLIDGGKPQLSAARRALLEAGVPEGEGGVWVCALAKAEELVFMPTYNHHTGEGQGVAELRLPLHGPALSLLRRLRDEAHACALLSHRVLRHTAEFSSVLDALGLPVGTQRRLREGLGSADALLAARPHELQHAAGGLLSEAEAAELAAALRRRAPRRAARLGSASELLGGHESAAAAAAASGRRAGHAVAGWAAEAGAARWWAQRRQLRLDALGADGASAERALLLRRVSSLLCALSAEEPPELAAGGGRAERVEALLRGWAEAGERRAADAAAAARGLAASFFPPEVEGEGAAGGADDEQGALPASARGAAVARGPQALFELHAPYAASGDQPAAIDALHAQLSAGAARVALLGATGTGKTFACASLIERLQRPALLLAPNKVLAAQLCAELKAFFPRNSVHYFASNFDYYRPEAFNAVSGNYVEKVSRVNAAVDALRHAATCALFERRDVIVVATVSCIYGLGVPEAYLQRALLAHGGQRWRSLASLCAALTELGYRPAAGGQGPVPRGEFRLSRARAARGGGPPAAVVELAPVAEGSGGPSRRVLRLELGTAGVGGRQGGRGGRGGALGGLVDAEEAEAGADLGWAASAADAPAGGTHVYEDDEEDEDAEESAAGVAAALDGQWGGGWELRAIRAVHVPTRAAAAGADGAERGDAEEEDAEPAPPSSRAELAVRLLSGGVAAGVSPAAALPAEELLEEVVLYPASHHVSAHGELERVLAAIASELDERVAALSGAGQRLEAERLASRVGADLRALAAGGAVRGIENYSRHLDGSRKPGEPPRTLLDYLPQDDWLLFVDESHLTVAQLGAMHAGDSKRKASLIQHGFRLPSAADNRPLTADEFWARVPQAVLVSATPGPELAMCGPSAPLAEMLIRPTGVLDPLVTVVPAEAYEDHLLALIEARRARGERCLVTALTKRSAEALSAFLGQRGVASAHLHADVDGAARLGALERLRSGELDVLVGCNLLREGIDLPEVSLVAVLDADKMGFLRSATSLVQTIGRAARHVRGEAVLYSEGGKCSPAMEEAIRETERRRLVQVRFNEQHGTAPTPLRPTDRSGKRAPSAVEHERAALLAILNGGGRAKGGAARLPPGGSLAGLARVRYDAIRAWRDAAARAAQARPFMLLTEGTMVALAAHEPPPADAAALLRVKGIGPVKAGRYGEQLLRALAEAGGADGARTDGGAPSERAEGELAAA